MVVLITVGLFASMIVGIVVGIGVMAAIKKVDRMQEQEEHNVIDTFRHDFPRDFIVGQPTSVEKLSRGEISFEEYLEETSIL